MIGVKDFVLAEYPNYDAILDMLADMEQARADGNHVFLRRDAGDPRLLVSGFVSGPPTYWHNPQRGTWHRSALDAMPGKRTSVTRAADLEPAAA